MGAVHSLHPGVKAYGVGRDTMAPSDGTAPGGKEKQGRRRLLQAGRTPRGVPARAPDGLDRGEGLLGGGWAFAG